MSLFSAVEMAPRDPILGLNEAFNADTRPGKINLGVGVYYNEEGRIPLLRAVQAAEKARIEAHAPRGYLPIEGIAAYDQGVQKLLFGNESELLAAGRVVTTQAVGGTGALKLGADFLKRLLPDATVAISDPSWENHRALPEPVTPSRVWCESPASSPSTICRMASGWSPAGLKRESSWNVSMKNLAGRNS